MDKFRKIFVVEAVSLAAFLAAFAVTFIMTPGTARSAAGLACLAVSWVVALVGFYMWKKLSKDERGELDKKYSKWIFPPSFLVKVIPIGLPVALLGLIVSMLK